MSAIKGPGGEDRRPTDPYNQVDREAVERQLAEMRSQLPEPESAPELPPDEERPTHPPCLECGGNFRIRQDTETGYAFVRCAWCTEGGMSPEQIAKWHARHEGRPPRQGP